MLRDRWKTSKEVIANSLPTKIYIFMCNAINAIRRKKHKISYENDENIHSVGDDKSKIYLCRRRRHNRYKNGVFTGIQGLAAQYHLTGIGSLKNGVLIDCGANIGELGIWAKSQGMSYIPFEPEELEARCCDLNNFEGNLETHRQALWCENTTLTFFSKPKSYDSSLIDPGNSDNNREVEAVRLDKVINPSEFDGPIVLKIEAEGAEPEVLMGATDMLPFVSWITVDCGFERGVEKAHTFVETNNFLQNNGFELVKARFRRVTALYKSRKLIV